VHRARTLIVVQVLRQSVNNLSIELKNFGGQCQSNVSRRSKVASKYQLFIWECGDIIPEHHPIIPHKFTYVADVDSAAGQDCLWHFAVGHINVVTCVRADQSFKLDTVVS
jgi:hypothetical protein